MTIQRLSIFPLGGAILFPGLQLPLHIFEPRYRALISDAMARDRMIGMVQPRGDRRKLAPPSDLFSVGCMGRIGEFEALDDGRYNIILEGIQRFTIISEMQVGTQFRQVEAELWEEGEMDDILSIAERASLERESRRFAEAQGYMVDWNSVSQLEDYSLVNAIAQIAPFDAAAKQALLETRGLAPRAELIVQLMEFFVRHDGPDDDITLQ